MYSVTNCQTSKKKYLWVLSETLTYQERKPKAVMYILYIPSRLILLDLKHQEKPWKPVPQQGLMGGGDRKYSSK